MVLGTRFGFGFAFRAHCNGLLQAVATALTTPVSPDHLPISRYLFTLV